MCIAAGCSLEAVYKEKQYPPTKMPDTGVWIADSSEIIAQLKQKLERTVDADDSQYYSKLAEIVEGFVNKAKTVTLPQAQEVKDAFLQHHPLQESYFEEARRQLAELRRQHKRVKQRLGQVRSKTRGMSGWQARRLVESVEEEEFQLGMKIARLEESLANKE